MRLVNHKVRLAPVRPGAPARSGWELMMEPPRVPGHGEGLAAVSYCSTAEVG
jgi:hypothetical protein